MLLAELFSGKRLRPLGYTVLAVFVCAIAYRRVSHSERVRTTRAAIVDVEQAVYAFRAELDRCPRSLIELMHPPSERAQYLSAMPRDAWGKELLLRCPGELKPHSADVVSAGPSGSFSVDDNIY